MCKIHTEYWSSFSFHCEKFPSVKKFTLAPLLMLVLVMLGMVMACDVSPVAMFSLDFCILHADRDGLN